jgi:branched-subunit amino acid aminotransferase/4-amino-4-deoxychorismate lyase
MSSRALPFIEVDGRPATAAQLGHAALLNYGHFTAMKVSGGRVRGLDLHLERLDRATQELFGAELDGELVRRRLRAALGDDGGDRSVRVDVRSPDLDGAVSIMVTVRELPDVAPRPQRLQTVRYQRPVPHIKHVGTFGQIHHGLAAERNGFDDALLTGDDGAIAEAAIANIGFHDGATIVWPTAPALPGITLLLLQRELARRDLPTAHAAVRVADLPSFRAAFVTNSLGIAPVGRIDDRHLPVDPDLMGTLHETYESVPWDTL